MVTVLVPAQQKGLKTGVSIFEELNTRHDAIMLFEEAKRRLLDVNDWHRLCGPGSAEFQLTDDRGRELRKQVAEIGDLIRIKLPAPSDPNGDGYDWVRVEEFESQKDMLKDEDVFGFRVRPVQSPFRRDTSASHFYTSSATSSFLVVRTSSTVTAMERGRNEVPNNRVKALVSKVRNTALSIGAWLGFSKTQWSKLVKGVIKGPPEQD